MARSNHVASLKRRVAKLKATERGRTRSANVGPSRWGPRSGMHEFTGEKPLEPEPCSLCGADPRSHPRGAGSKGEIEPAEKPYGDLSSLT